MEFQAGGNGSSGDKDGPNPRQERKVYSRHSPRQIQVLEAFFKDCPHPGETQRHQLSVELGLESRQIKFWFQNKRTQTKSQYERAGNSMLRAENERIRSENLAMSEELKNVICPSCGGPPGEEERKRNIEKLQLENSQLKEEHEKVSNLLARYIGKSVKQMNSLPPPGFPNKKIDAPDNASMKYNLSGFLNPENDLMFETATLAMDELIRLLQINEPLWIQSLTNEKYVLNHDIYERIFPKAKQFKTSNAQIESSKDSVVVAMNGVHLVDMILDPNKYRDLFPTIIVKASTIRVLEVGQIGSGSGSLQLMYEKMHILSPLVAPREFYFLRYCQEIERGVWVIVDVSHDYSKKIKPSSSCRSWKLPSGCMIKDLPDGCSKVTWVEHVQVDNKTKPSQLYNDLIIGHLGFGAERMVGTLQRMCERFAYLADENTPTRDLAGVISSPKGRRSITKLGHRMVKDFCGVLSMSENFEFPQLFEGDNNGVRVSIRQNAKPSQPDGMIVSATTSLWLPMPWQTIFDFIRDEKMRPQWDVLCIGNPVHEIAYIANGINPGNCTTIIRPFVPNENNLLMLQESCVEPLGALVVYAPIDIPTINIAVSGEEPANIPILPSGFIVSNDGRSETRSGGSILTITFQILVCGPATSQQQLSRESFATINTLISSTVQNIKTALNSSGFD